MQTFQCQNVPIFPEQIPHYDLRVSINSGLEVPAQLKGGKS